jgi:hypothetical protein
LPGSIEDKIDSVVDGVKISRYPKNTSSGEFNIEKLEVLLRNKGLYDKIFKIKKVSFIDKDEILNLLAQRKISHEEYLSCTQQNLVSVLSLNIVESNDIESQ